MTLLKKLKGISRAIYGECILCIKILYTLVSYRFDSVHCTYIQYTRIPDTCTYYTKIVLSRVLNLIEHSKYIII